MNFALNHLPSIITIIYTVGGVVLFALSKAAANGDALTRSVRREPSERLLRLIDRAKKQARQRRRADFSKLFLVQKVLRRI